MVTKRMRTRGYDHPRKRNWSFCQTAALRIETFSIENDLRNKRRHFIVSSNSLFASPLTIDMNSEVDGLKPVTIFMD